MQGAENGIAVLNRVHDDAHRHQIVDVVEFLPPHDHLLVNRVVVLRAPGDGAFDLADAQVLLDLEADLPQVLLTGGSPLGDHVLDLVVDARVQRFEGTILQLPLDGIHTQPVSQWSVDLQGLLGLTSGVVRRDVLPGAGVVEAIAEFDHKHANVFGHGDDHLAHRLGLSRIPVLEFVELGDAIDQESDLVAEVAAQPLQGVVGVLHGVVQQGGGQGLRCHAELRQDGRHRHRMGDVRLPGLPLLTGMSLLGHLIGPHDETGVGLGVVGPQCSHKRLDGRGCRVPP